MNSEMANLALAFLQRVELKGAEAPRFMQLVQALQGVVNAEQLGIEYEKPTSD